MASKIKLKLKGFEPGAILPYGWDPFPGKWGGTVIGHEFTMVGIFQMVSEWAFSDVRDMFTLPALEWREKEFWWERNVSGGWDYLGETDKGDLYQTAPGSETWNAFAQGKADVRDHSWLDKPGAGVRPELLSKLVTLQQQTQINTAKAQLATLQTTQKHRDLEAQANVRGQRNASEIALWWLQAENFAKQHTKIPCAALDRPGVALSGGSGASGGGFRSLTTSPSRRRVLQFDLGIRGWATRYTATQVIETLNGQPSISKFIMPGMSDEWVKDIPEAYLAYWRGRLNTADVEDQDFTLESQDVVDAYVPPFTTPTVTPTVVVPSTTPWVSGVKPPPQLGRARSNAVWTR